jgi:hypothetical protein
MFKKTEQLLGKKPELSEKIILENGFKIDFLTFNNRPFLGATSIITQGIRKLSNCDKDIILIYSTFSESVNFELISLIATYLDLHYFKQEYHIDFGDILYINNFKLIAGTDFEGFYTLHPSYYEGILENDRYIWLLPIFKSEFDYIKKYGSDAFQKIIEMKDPDLSDLKRFSII